MHADDEPVGRLLDRRRALTLFGAAAGGLLAAGAGVAQGNTPTGPRYPLNCVAKPAMTEGPYFVDEKLNRSDIRTDPSDGSVVDGIMLALNLSVLQVNGACAPLKDAQVDIWQCDALGVYSDVLWAGTTGKKFLRGYQITNGEGSARFVTILPGWYMGRTVHIHFKIRTTGTDGNPYEFTSQLYFTEQFKASYMTANPYAGKGSPDTTNDTDWIYLDDQMLLQPVERIDGYAAEFAIGLDLSNAAVGAED